MNNRLLTLWVLLLVGILLVACGGSAAEPTAAPEATEVVTAVEEPAAEEPAVEDQQLKNRLLTLSNYS